MAMTSLARRGAGRVLVALGLLGLVALAFATPLAFTAQTGTVAELLMLAALAGAISFALLLIGDRLARPRKTRAPAGTAGLPRGRSPRDRRISTPGAAAEPMHIPASRASR